MNNTKQIPLWLQRLWKIWYGLIAVLFVVRFAFLNRADFPEQSRCGYAVFVFAAYLLIAWLPLMFICGNIITRNARFGAVLAL